jgi:ABC-2 type transport system permease protein
VQFYFIAPVRMRDVMLAKNLLTCSVFAIEAILIYIAAAVISAPSPLDLTAATLAWSLFALFLNMSVGNIRSIVSPKVLDPAKVRSQNVSGLNSLISLVVVAAAVGMGALMAVLCQYFHTSYWPAAAVFLILATLSFVAYALVLNKVDEIAANNIEGLISILGKV